MAYQLYYKGSQMKLDKHSKAVMIGDSITDAG